MDWKEEYRKKIRTADEAVKIVKDGDIVHIGTASCIAYELAEALYRRKKELHGVRISSAVNLKLLPFYTDEKNDSFSVFTYFAGPAEREALQHGNCRYSSLHLSRVDQWCRDFLSGGVAFLEVSPPDENGCMSYGTYTAMHDDVRAACSRVVLQVNQNAPYVYGRKNLIHVSQADYIVEADSPLAVVPDAPVDETLKKISSYIVEQIPDGATIQLGLGGLSGAVGYGLENKNDLGVHSEMLTNSMMKLMQKGVINNRKKNFNPGRAVVGFALGSPELYAFADHNPNLMFTPFTYVNDPAMIAQNDHFISVNTAMSIDLFGQVAADNIGGRQISAIGGQVDFVRGAQMSKGGKSFIAMTAALENKKGRSSRIVPVLPPGTAVTTGRADVQYVVTEYGCVNLKKLDNSDRAKALIELAHPAFREQLRDQAKELHLL
ncbi:MAG: acetyl-CoA hydrolase [Lachnospiraceae bacterium]|nr:acetyl-CoA hydrolase [Lachnospiraceae bacterium]